MSVSSLVSILNYIDIQWSIVVPASNGLFSTAHNPRAIWHLNFEPQRHLSVIFRTSTCSNRSANVATATRPQSHLVLKLWTRETSVSHPLAHDPRVSYCWNFELQRHLPVIFITPTCSNRSASNCHWDTTPESSTVNFELQRHISVIFFTPTCSNGSASNCHCHTTAESSSVN